MKLSTLLLALAFLSIEVNAAIYPYVAPNALFGFTDSLSDTGNLHIAMPGQFPADYPPYGVTIGKVTGRWSDGLLIIDFLNENFTGALEPPSLGQDPKSNAYTSLGFGSAGATVLPQPYANMNPDILPAQVSQFLAYQKKIIAAKTATSKDFSDALYYVEIGGNDINFALAPGNRSFDDIAANVIPGVVQSLRDNIANLHVNGSAVHFLIFNMPAAGCAPVYLARMKDAAHDRLGCVDVMNKLVSRFNKEIKTAVNSLRREYPSGNFMYFDFYAASLDVMRNGWDLGFVEKTAACCGSGGAYNCTASPIGCGCGQNVVPCSDPETHISWDGVHYTQKFYQVIANMILKQRYLDPPTPLKHHA